jgi:hypothetical protein
MNFRTTLGLAVLVAAGVGVVAYGLQLPGRSGSTAAVAESSAALKGLSPETLSRIEIDRGGKQTVLTRDGDVWTLPGGWPTRPVEVKSLVEMLGRLRSRFVPETVLLDDKLEKYGLDKPAVVVRLKTTTGGQHTLAFGEESEEHLARRVDAADLYAARAARPTYVRVDDLPEVERLAPGLLVALDRDTTYYQQRRLFPYERVARDEDKQEKVDKLLATNVTVDQTTKDKPLHYALSKEASDWILTAPQRDRLDPKAADAFLAAVPDLWAEKFVAPASPADAAAALTKYGLQPPERTLQVAGPGGAKKLLVGGQSSVNTRKVMRPQPTPPGSPFPLPPREETVTEEYRYAKLEGNDQIFEIKADKLKDVFVPLDTLRDAQTVRFKPDDARSLEVVAGGQTISLVKEGARWKLVKPFQADADAAKVSDLLTKLAGLEARDKDVLTDLKPEMYGLDKPSAVVTVGVEEEIPGEGDPKPKNSRSARMTRPPKSSTSKTPLGPASTPSMKACSPSRPVRPWPTAGPASSTSPPATSTPLKSSGPPAPSASSRTRAFGNSPPRSRTTRTPPRSAPWPAVSAASKPSNTSPTTPRAISTRSTASASPLWPSA